MNDQKIIRITADDSISLKSLIEITQYKDLYYYLVRSDIKSMYKQSVLGIGWAVLNPLVTMVVFTLVFNKFANIKSDGSPYPVFSYVAIIPWLYFSNVVNQSTGAVIGKANILQKVYIPKILIPLVPVLSNFLNFAISFVFLIAMLIYYGIVPNYNIIFLPMLIATTVIFGLGIALLVSSYAVQYRDFLHLMRFLVQILMFLSPIIWPVSNIPEQYQSIYSLYPMVGVIEGFRSAIVGVNEFPYFYMITGFASSIIIFVIGFYSFSSMEKYYADIV